MEELKNRIEALCKIGKELIDKRKSERNMIELMKDIQFHKLTERVATFMTVLIMIKDIESKEK